MNKFNRKLLDGMIGKQDERERLETYERMAVCYAYLYWGSLLVCWVSWMIGWETGQYALLLALLLGIPMHGWAKFNDLSSSVISESEKITPETAKEVLRKARNAALLDGLMAAAMTFVTGKLYAKDVPFLWILPFAVLLFLAIAGGTYSSACIRVKKTLRELREDEGGD
jgi:hypothetical protein